MDKDSYFIKEPKYSIEARNSDDWEPEWIEERFSLRLRCIEAACGEIVMVSGETVLIQADDEEFQNSLVTALRPKWMFPAPPIFQLPQDTPWAVEQLIKSAFALFWFDYSASANALRKSLESLLDNFAIPKTGASSKGKIINLDLNARIANYEKGNQEHGQTFQALRVIGNIGSHQASMKRNVLLDAFEIYGDAMEELIGGRKKFIEKIKKNILATKGKY